MQTKYGLTPVAKAFYTRVTNDTVLDTPIIKITRIDENGMTHIQPLKMQRVVRIKAEFYASLGVDDCSINNIYDPKSAEAYMVEQLKKEILFAVYGETVEELRIIAKQLMEGGWERGKHEADIHALIDKLQKI